MALRLHDCIIEQRPESVSEPVPIIGWPLAALARLDRDGAHGLVAELCLAGILTRQASFVVAATVDLAAPDAFLLRLGIAIRGAEGIGIALRTRRARQIIAAAYGVEPDEVPTGYLRALAKIQEVGADKPGLDPFEDPTSYRRLIEIMTRERLGRRAHVLRYCQKLRSSTIDAVLRLDPLLLHPEIVGVIGNRQRITAANGLIALIRSCHTAIDEQGLVTAMRQSISSLGVFEVFARKALDTADNLPAPLPAAEGIRPLRTAADYRAIGSKLRNCAATKVAEVALGLLAVVEVTHRAEDGAETVLAVSLAPTIDGRWMVSEVGGPKNRKPQREVLGPVLQRLRDLGAIIPGPSPGGAYRKDLADMLGIYRYVPLDDALHPHGVGEEDEVLAAFEAEAEEAA